MHLYDIETSIVGRAATSFAENMAEEAATDWQSVATWPLIVRLRGGERVNLSNTSDQYPSRIIIDNRRGFRRRIVVNEGGGIRICETRAKKRQVFFFFLLNFRPRKIYRPICFSLSARVWVSLEKLWIFFFSLKVFAIFHNLTCPRRANLLSDTVVTLSFHLISIQKYLFKHVKIVWNEISLSEEKFSNK